MLSTSHPAPKMAFHSLAEHKLFTFEEASRKEVERKHHQRRSRLALCIKFHLGSGAYMMEIADREK